MVIVTIEAFTGSIHRNQLHYYDYDGAKRRQRRDRKSRRQLLCVAAAGAYSNPQVVARLYLTIGTTTTVGKNPAFEIHRVKRLEGTSYYLNFKIFEMSRPLGPLSPSLVSFGLGLFP